MGNDLAQLAGHEPADAQMLFEEVVNAVQRSKICVVRNRDPAFAASENKTVVAEFVPLDVVQATLRRCSKEDWQGIARGLDVYRQAYTGEPGKQ